MENIQPYPQNELLTVQQAADYLGLQKQTLDKWRSQQSVDLPFVRLGNRVRYRKEALDKWLREKEITHRQTPVQHGRLAWSR